LVNNIAIPIAPIGFYKTESTAIAPQPISTTKSITVEAQLDQVSEMNKRMGDSPACSTCGHITIRSGSCYKCLNCGTQTGCS
jgi:ribonucleoside-diphosphate reductase alpha chain